MKQFRVYFQVTSDFYEIAEGQTAEHAVAAARAYVEENINTARFGTATDVEVVKVEQMETCDVS